MSNQDDGLTKYYVKCLNDVDYYTIECKLMAKHEGDMCVFLNDEGQGVVYIPMANIEVVTTNYNLVKQFCYSHEERNKRRTR